ncbi:MAG: hypothetical protein M0009_00095 [Deltaproteobacteria bacterium]|nr:hypothetical protein [Deltaproteobacteria bacterium]
MVDGCIFYSRTLAASELPEREEKRRGNKGHQASALMPIFWVVIFSAIAILTLGATEARAYCVYNNTKQYLSEVHGEFCARCLSTSMLSPDASTCCPGDKSGCRGKTWITVRVPNSVWQTGEHYKHCAKEVTAHGWVKIYGTGDALRCEVYDDNGAQLTGAPMEEGKKE